MNTLEGKKILVIGASGGMGTFVVDEIVKQGGQVVAVDIREPKSSSALLNLVCDVTNEDSVKNAVAKSAEVMGGLTGLAYITGINHEATAIENFEISKWDHVFDVNIKGVIRAAHHVVPLLKANGGGSIVTTTSWWSHRGHAYFAAYCASKSALISLTQSMAEELARDQIRVNSVAPGNIDTSMHTDALQSEAEKRGISFDEMKKIEWDKIPMGFAGPPQSIADSVAFLLSDKSSYMTGSRIDVNGGVSMA